jgi:Ca-activated chloride channel family protein
MHHNFQIHAEKLRGAGWLRVLALALACALGLGAGALCAQPVITLEAEPDQSFYREDAASEIFVQARIRTALAPAATAGAPAESAPLRNIAFVLDRSGSMDGDRMAALQAALTGALDSLADRDVVSVVVFGSEVETLIEAQRCDQARETLARSGPMESAGGAALYDGLSQGAAQARRYAGPGTVNQLLLVTDGAATKGPRERDDFVRLVETFAREGISVSTIGVGDEFEEDLLATLARIGGGGFQFADQPAKLNEAILREVAPRQAIVANDAVLTIEYRGMCDDVKAHGARVAAVVKNTVTYRFPQLTAGQELSVLASGQLDSFRTQSMQRDLVRVRLRWTDPASGEVRELAQAVTVRFSPETRDLVDSFNIRVYRAAVAALISEGMQKSIEQVDKGDFRRAVRELRRTRDRARDVNYYPEDPEIDAMVARLDAYIAEVQARGMNVLDRKILRSGLFNQFEMPTEDMVEAKK